MSLEVEDGTGKTNAESYLSVADADTYHTNYTASTDWSGAATATKERALRLATQFIDAEYKERWKGYRTNSDQALDWPRSDVTDADGYLVDSDSVPAKLEQATAELALKVIEGTELIPDIENNGVVKSESVKVGPISETVAYFGKNPRTLFSLPNQLLQQFLIGTASVERC